MCTQVYIGETIYLLISKYVCSLIKERYKLEINTITGALISADMNIGNFNLYRHAYSQLNRMEFSQKK